MGKEECNMTINDFIYYAIESQYVEIWSMDEEGIVWSGWSEDIPDKYLEMDVHSWNGVAHKIMGGGICFNID